MGNLFGKSKVRKFRDDNVSDHDRAVLQIKQQRDKVKLYQKRLVTQLEQEKGLIKQLVADGQKPKALLLLKKRKFTENLLNKTDSELMNIETLISDIEFKNLEQNVLKGMQIGNEALKQLNAVFSIEQIENILGETEESIEKQKEINDLISGYKESDAESLNDELMAIIGVDETTKDEAEVEPSVDQTIELPDVPEDQPQIPEPSREKRKHDKVLVEA